jgi:sugar (pentulose or hexulose) kinase
MKNFLLIDFGASRVKSAIVNLSNGKLSFILDSPVPNNCSREANHFEIPLDSIKRQFKRICKYYFYNLRVEYDGIMLSSQMHGFILVDAKNNPLSNYISWKDERSLEKIKRVSTFSILSKEFKDEFKKITGMVLRPGLPFSNIIHLARKKCLNKPFKVITLPEFISMCDNDSMNYVHDSMLAGIGFYDIKRRGISKKLLRIFKDFSNKEPTFNNAAKEDCVSGYVKLSSRKIPIFVGVGDLQCAVLGAGNEMAKSISVNIGTGSQVSIISRRADFGNYELRPYFDKLYLKTFTHIPAGRALEEFINFIAYTEDKRENIWSELKKISESSIEKSTLCFNLNMFRSAWRYRSGGGILNIHEGALTKDNYLASLLKSFIHQYIEAINLIADNKRFNSIIISGGVVKRLPRISLIISTSTQKKVLVNWKFDETFIGLRSLALFASGAARTTLEAQKYFV